MTPYILIALIIAFVVLVYWRRSVTDDKNTDYNIDGHTLVEIEIPIDVSPMVRSDKYEEPLSKMMRDAGIGSCDGGGTELGNNGIVKSVFIDAYIKDTKHLDQLKKYCKDLKFPEGTKFKMDN